MKNYITIGLVSVEKFAGINYVRCVLGPVLISRTVCLAEQEVVECMSSIVPFVPHNITCHPQLYFKRSLLGYFGVRNTFQTMFHRGPASSYRITKRL